MTDLRGLWNISEAWENMLYDIYYDGEDYKKDDALIREKLGYFYRLYNPMLGMGFGSMITSQHFIDLVKKGAFDIDGYPIKGIALANYIKSLDNDDFIYLNTNDNRDFVYTYPERLQALWTCDENGSYKFWNQIKVMIERLKNNLGSNRAVATLYQVGLDHDRVDIPCLNWLQFTVRNNRLTLHVVFRSNDIYGAWPSNMYFLTYLGLKVQEKLQEEYPSVVFSDINYHVSSAHIYHTDLDAVKKVVK